MSHSTWLRQLRQLQIPALGSFSARRHWSNQTAVPAAFARQQREPVPEQLRPKARPWKLRNLKPNAVAGGPLRVGPWMELTNYLASRLFRSFRAPDTSLKALRRTFLLASFPNHLEPTTAALLLAEQRLVRRYSAWAA